MLYSFDSTLHIVQLALDTSEGGEDFLLSGHCAWRVSDAFAPLAVSYAILAVRKDDTTREAGFLAFVYPASDAEELKKTIGTIDR